MSRVTNVLRTAAEWTTDNPVLGAGQTGVEKFTNKTKTGNGVSPWASLKYNSTVADHTLVALGNSGAAKTVPDPVTGARVVSATLTANCTLTFPDPRAAAEFELLLAQDATGSRLVTWPASVKWPANTAPTLTTTASKRDRLKFVSDGVNWFGSTVGLAYV